MYYVKIQNVRNIKAQKFTPFFTKIINNHPLVNVMAL